MGRTGNTGRISRRGRREAGPGRGLTRHPALGTCLLSDGAPTVFRSGPARERQFRHRQLMARFFALISGEELRIFTSAGARCGFVDKLGPGLGPGTGLPRPTSRRIRHDAATFSGSGYDIVLRLAAESRIHIEPPSGVGAHDINADVTLRDL